MVRDQGVGGSNPLSPTNYHLPVRRKAGQRMVLTSFLTRRIVCGAFPNREGCGGIGGFE